ncbi:MAG: glycosyltransferase [Burkholderiales bacterium]|nr:glycosyltransferase [Burkholderiales bacterium]
MRILMISDVYFPRVNGVSTAIMTLRRELRRMGHEVTLIAPDYGAVTADEEGILRIPARPVWLDPEDRMMQRRRITELLPYLQSQTFDLVHIHTPFIAHYAGLELARALGVPCIETYHTFFEEYLFHYVSFVPKFFMRYLARVFSRSQCAALDGLVVPSRPMLEALHHYGVDTHARVIPTGIELNDFSGGQGQRFREQHGIPAEQPLLLYVGRVAHEKNIGFLLETLTYLKHWHPEILLVIAGEGPASAALKRRTTDLNLDAHTRFVGYLNRSRELLDCYRAADLFVFSSRTETQGLVLLEAMALGVPVVGLAIMGTAEVLQHERGAHIAQDDVHQFARTVSALLNNGEARAALSLSAQEYVREWTAPEMTRRLAHFYEDVVCEYSPVMSRVPASVAG